MKKIQIKVGDLLVLGSLRDSQLAAKIWEALPFQGIVNTWGFEIYFSIPVATELEFPTKQVVLGDLAYWPSGNAFCLFFGRTPISATEDKIKPASEVETIGKMEGDFTKLKEVKPGTIVRIERATDQY